MMVFLVLIYNENYQTTLIILGVYITTWGQKSHCKKLKGYVIKFKCTKNDTLLYVTKNSYTLTCHNTYDFTVTKK